MKYSCFILLLLVACTPKVGTFDGGPTPDVDDEVTFTAADIGTACTYDGTVNPTNNCQQGLTCLIVTADGAFSPYAAGDPRNLSLSVWEDQFSVYRADGVDEGYCTLVGDFERPPQCPIGTELKLLAPRLSVCVKSCGQPADCVRPGYTCDFRFIDLQAGHCVRQCGLDIPDCIRSGQLLRADQTVALHLAEEDFRGESTCELSSGICGFREAQGTSQVGQACDNGEDCLIGLSCLQSEVLRSVDPSLPETTPGVCVRPCKPTADPENLERGFGCGQGEVCQAGFTFGHGNPLDDDLENGDGFLTVNLTDGTFSEGGGFCFRGCPELDECNILPGTQCGPPNEIFGFPSNSLSMCLPDALRR